MLMLSYESARKLHGYWYNFFVSLAACLFLTLGIIFIFFNMYDRPVITNLDSIFKVCTKTVKAGELLKYRIHYYKRLDIPGDITKQLILTVKDTGEIIYIPLSDTAGHLPVGKIDQFAYAQIPDWTPAGTGQIKLSSSYNLGLRVSHNTVFTEKFEVVR